MAYYITHKSLSFKSILLYAISIVCCVSIFGLLILAQQRNTKEIVKLRKSRENHENQREKLSLSQKQHYYYEEQRPVVVHAESFRQQDENDAKKKEYVNNYWKFYPSRSTVDSIEENSNEMLSKDNNFYYTRNYLNSMYNRVPQQSDRNMVRQQTTPPPLTEKSPQSNLNNFLNILRDLKKLWDIYNAFSEALNNHQVESNQTTPVVIHPRLMENQTKQPIEKIRSQTSLEKYDINRNKRQTPTNENQGRYIKGDPLKGYYDFVISEGSYKFWAVFQVGTAILIIYSTFAAIYYSKVNPLTTDYDYTDYLGGARSFPTDDLDFDDVGDNNKISKENSSEGITTWYDNLTPRIGGVLKNVLEFFDKLPINNDTKVDTLRRENTELSNINLNKYEMHRKKLKRQIFNLM